MPLRTVLLGAGFTRNWGGWLASELTGELCGIVADDEDLVRRLKETRNFERVLADVRVEARAGVAAHRRFERLQQATLDVFNRMNQALAKGGFEFRVAGGKQRWVATFLAEFDAIFTLNQDLLLELHYVPGKAMTRWQGSAYPGIDLPADWLDSLPAGRLERNLRAGGPSQVADGIQPIYKLHGSVNWISDDGSHVVVVGDGKDRTIRENTLLMGYLEELERCLSAGDTRLMVIGYSFADRHINDVIEAASRTKGLRTYLVDPAGLSMFDPPPNALITRPSDVFFALRPAGILTRPLRQAFESDDLAFESLWRFLDISS